MRKLAFSEPVSIFVGLDFPCDVADVLEAYKILNDWPHSTRDAGHLTALHTCAAVLGGHGTATEARRALYDFAEEHGMLNQEALQRSAHRLKSSCRPGGVDLTANQAQGPDSIGKSRPRYANANRDQPR